MDRDQKARLRFFFDFINLDLSNLSGEEQAQVAANLARHCDWKLEKAQQAEVMRGNEEESVPTQADTHFIVPSVDQVQEFQRHLKEFFLERIVASIRKVGLDRLWEQEYGIWAKRKALSFKIGSLRAPIMLEASLMFEEPTGSDSSPHAKKSWHSGLDSEAPVQTVLVPPRNSDGVVFKFLQTLAGIRVRDLGECPECGKWFVRLSRPDKRFCSHLCSSRSGNRTRYLLRKETDRKKHERELVQGRERAHKSYKRKMARVHGSKVKVTRRPRIKQSEGT